MEYSTKIKELREHILSTLNPLIDNDYILTDLPYHQNLGDILIWEGEKAFCRQLPYKCLGISNPVTFTFPILPPNVIILLNGGGNFGDLWRSSQEFRLDIIKKYPNNRIIIFPQSIWYENLELVKSDAEIFAKHKDLHICVRDLYSYNFLKGNFDCKNVYLIPDMAFCITESTLTPFRKHVTDNLLFLKRSDKEYKANRLEPTNTNFHVHDWPTIERIPMQAYFLIKLCGIIRRLPIKSIVRQILSNLANDYADAVFRKKMLLTGYNFISKYSSVTTTRLHAMILAVLLHKPVSFIDNSTLKVSGFADMWLSDLESVKALK